MTMRAELAALRSVESADAWRDPATWRQYLTWRRDTAGKSRQTVIKDASVATAWLDWSNAGGRRSSSVDADMIEAFAGRRRVHGVRAHGQVGSPSTRKGDIAALRSFGEWATARGLVAANVAKLAVAPDVPRKVPRALSHDDWLRLWCGVTSDEGRVALGLMGLFGLRRHEVASLQVEQFTAAGTIDPLVRKGADEHVFPWREVLSILAARAPQDVVDAAWFSGALERLVGGRLSGSLWRRDARVRDSWVNALLGRWCAELGVSQVNPHALRDTAITRLVAIGVPLHLCKELAGHSSVDMTLAYTRKSGAELAAWRRSEGM